MRPDSIFALPQLAIYPFILSHFILITGESSELD